jgi:hypothetical protein
MPVWGRAAVPLTSNYPVVSMTSVMNNLSSVRNFHSSSPARGFEEFYDPIGPDVTITTGRGWSAPELRRKVKIHI